MGVLIEFAEDDAEAQARLAALREGLAALGWEEGRNLRADVRFGAGNMARIQALAKELATSAPDVVLGSGAPVTAALQRATGTVPIVFVQISDPVGAGLVPSLGKPGGNLTGFTNFEYGMAAKWLEALTEIAPSIGRVYPKSRKLRMDWIYSYYRRCSTIFPCASCTGRSE
jgi:putative ABC transport system substrate-binding protein